MNGKRGMRERLIMLLADEKEDFPFLETNAAHPDLDRTGGATRILSGSRRRLGLGEFLLLGDGEVFRRNLAEAARLRLGLVRRHKAGGPIDNSYVSILLYKNAFDALASGDAQLARELCEVLGGRPEIEREHDHPFDLALGYALKHSVLGDVDEVGRTATILAGLCRVRENADFRGYAQAFEALCTGDQGQIDTAFPAIVKGHRRQSKGNGVFAGTIDELLCIWGIGLANLCVHRGMRVEIDDPLMPPELIVGLR